MKTTVLVLLSLTVIVAACGVDPDAGAGNGSAEGDGPTVGTSTTQPPSSTTSRPPSTDTARGEEDQYSVDVDPDLADAIELAAADLAARLGMGDADIEVFAAESVTWRDSSLGCPVAGQTYLQVLVEDGYRIVLTADGRLYHYHGSGAQQPIFCSDPQEPYDSGS